MTTVAGVPASRLSKSSLISFICGILGCIPYLTGLLAVVLGIVGFIRTGKPGVKGRWMAVVGGVLGLASIVGWTIFGGGILAIVWATSGPRDASHAFLKDLAAGNISAAVAKTNGVSAEELEAMSKFMAANGGYKDATFFSTNVRNNVAEMEGVAEFGKGTARVAVEMEKDGSDWKVISVEFGTVK